jgi:hypothetical protein
MSMKLKVASDGGRCGGNNIPISGEWRVASGEWRMENGEWRMENGEWRMENGEWRMVVSQGEQFK